jgi:hypothetical protein
MIVDDVSSAVMKDVDRFTCCGKTDKLE